MKIMYVVFCCWRRASGSINAVVVKLIKPEVGWNCRWKRGFGRK